MPKAISWMMDHIPWYVQVMRDAELALAWQHGRQAEKVAVLQRQIEAKPAETQVLIASLPIVPTGCLLSQVCGTCTRPITD